MQRNYNFQRSNALSVWLLSANVYLGACQQNPFKAINLLKPNDIYIYVVPQR